MLQLQLFLAFVGISLASSQFGDPCYLSPHQPQAGSSQIDLLIPSNCQNGSVDWNYPRGTIDLQMIRQDGPYSLCLVESWGTSLGGLSKVVNEVTTDIPVPTADHPACTDDVNGKTEFVVKATELLMYMTIFDYKVVPRVAT